MNKTYKRPEISMREMLAQSMLTLSSIGINNTTAADANYTGGGDSKIRIVDVLGSDQSSDDSEDW